MLSKEFSIMIRNVRIEDSGAIAAIYNHYVVNSTVTFEVEAITGTEIAKRIQANLDADLPWLIAEVEGNVIGNKGLIVEGVCDIEIGKKSYITYVKDESYEKYLKESAASVAIIHKDVSIKNIKKTFIVVENPSLAFIKVLNFQEFM